MIVVPARIAILALRPLIRFFDRYLMTPVFNLLSDGLDRAIRWLFARIRAGVVAAARWISRWLDPWFDRVVADIGTAAPRPSGRLDPWSDRVAAGIDGAARWPWRHLVVPVATAVGRALSVVWSWVIRVPHRACQAVRPLLRWLADRLGRVVAAGWRSLVRPIVWLARRVVPMALGLWGVLRLALRLVWSRVTDVLLDALGLPFQRLILQIVRLLIPVLDWLADRFASASAAAWRLFVRAARWVYRSLLRPAGTTVVWLWRHTVVPAKAAMEWAWRHSAKPAGAAVARGWR